MSVCIPTYMLASGLIAGGMNWWQAVGTILLGNLIVLVPMLNAIPTHPPRMHGGHRYRYLRIMLLLSARPVITPNAVCVPRWHMYEMATNRRDGFVNITSLIVGKADKPADKDWPSRSRF
jgi:hypothetical protein